MQGAAAPGPGVGGDLIGVQLDPAELARAAAAQDMAFAIGAKRISSMWKALAAVPDDAWRDAIDMDRAPRCAYRHPDGTAAGTDS